MPKLLNELIRNNSAQVGPLWEGPAGEGPNGGITQSLLARFLCCRERFRILVEGLKPAEKWERPLGYGDMWHVCEEELAATKTFTGEPLRRHCQQACREHPLQRAEIEHWFYVCATQFPIYVEYWKKHPQVTNRTPIYAEKQFSSFYKLPSGRAVRLRGKFDAVDLINGEVFLQENKTKADVDESVMRRFLESGFDIQVGTYLTALSLDPEVTKRGPIAGVSYNVVRRPLSGGKGSIVQKKGTKANPAGESAKEFYGRLREIIAVEDPDNGKPGPGYFFHRWEVRIPPTDVRRFQKQTLNGALEQLCDWWEWVISPAGRKDPFANPVHYRYPYGIYNPLNEDRMGDVDAYLNHGSISGFRRATTLFPELA